MDTKKISNRENYKELWNIVTDPKADPATLDKIAREEDYPGYFRIAVAMNRNTEKSTLIYLSENGDTPSIRALARDRLLKSLYRKIKIK